MDIGRETYKNDRSIGEQLMRSRPAIFAPAPAQREVPTFGVESAKDTKGKHIYLYKQLDGSYATLATCICDLSQNGALLCPIDTHRIPAVQRNPMWQWSDIK